MDHRYDHSKRSVAGLRTAFFLNLDFTLLEIFVGVLTKSVAILYDDVQPQTLEQELRQIPRTSRTHRTYGRG